MPPEASSTPIPARRRRVAHIGRLVELRAGNYAGVEAVDERRWQTRVEARPSAVPHLRRDVLDVLGRECPGVDLATAALIVTELAGDVVNHAYGDTGPVEVELLCEPDAATLTVRDWGQGFGGS